MKIIRNPGECTPLSIQDELLRVDWTNLGEGLHGDYDPDDPEDINLLRFDVLLRQNGAINDWEPISDASYCTNVPASASPEVLESTLMHIFESYRTAIEQNPGESLKRLGEKLSHISDAEVDAPVQEEQEWNMGGLCQ